MNIWNWNIYISECIMFKASFIDTTNKAVTLIYYFLVNINCVKSRYFNLLPDHHLDQERNKNPACSAWPQFQTKLSWCICRNASNNYYNPCKKLTLFLTNTSNPKLSFSQKKVDLLQLTCIKHKADTQEASWIFYSSFN